MDASDSPVERAIVVANSFEAEVLVVLALRYWRHPLAEDADYRNWLLESSTEALLLCSGGTQLIDSVPPSQMNLVAAIWYVEGCAIPDNDPTADARRAWLESFRRALPSCFCDQSELY